MILGSSPRPNESLRRNATRSRLCEGTRNKCLTLSSFYNNIIIISSKDVSGQVCPKLTFFFYADEKGECPVHAWLNELARKDAKAAAGCIARIRLLANLGHELRRPHADYLRDGIYELRTKRGRVNYRILYFYHGKNVALLAHGLTKEKEVPAAEIDRAIARKQKYEQDPEKHRGEIEA